MWVYLELSNFQMNIITSLFFFLHSIHSKASSPFIWSGLAIMPIELNDFAIPEKKGFKNSIYILLVVALLCSDRLSDVWSEWLAILPIYIHTIRTQFLYGSQRQERNWSETILLLFCSSFFTRKHPIERWILRESIIIIQLPIQAETTTTKKKNMRTKNELQKHTKIIKKQSKIRTRSRSFGDLWIV